MGKRGRKPKKALPPMTTIECMRCGTVKQEKEFYVNEDSKMYTKKRVPICKDCIQELIYEYTYQYGEKVALYLICAAMDVPYLPNLYDKITKTGATSSFKIGKYLRQLQMCQYRNQSFADTVINGIFPSTEHTENKSCRNTNSLREEISIIREELHDLKAHITESKANHK